MDKVLTGHLGSLFVSWSRPQPHIVHPFFSSRLKAHVFLFSKLAPSCGNKLPPLEHSESKPWLVIGLLQCGFALSISKPRNVIFTHKLSRSQAQRQGGPQSSTNATSEYEMSGLQNQDRITNGGRASSSDGMTRFYNQVCSRQNLYQFMFLMLFCQRYPVFKMSSDGSTRM